MKESQITTWILLMAAIVIGLHGQNTESPDLRQEVLYAMRPTDYNEGEPYTPFDERLRALGRREGVGGVLRQLVQENRDAKDGDYPGRYRLEVAIAGIRVLKIQEAIPLLRDIAGDASSPSGARSEAVRAIGALDPEGSKTVLVDALRSTGRNAYWIRQCAAEALANVKDPVIAQVLEAEAQTERDEFIKSKLQEAAASVRANAAARQNEPK